MWLDTIRIENCRLLSNVNLKLSPKINIIVGDNASGKTSLLEALTILSSGRSFRTSHISDVITYNKKNLLVSAKLKNNDGLTSQIGLDKNNTKTRIRINNKNIFSQSELSLHLPLTIIHPGSIDLITGSPSVRRAFIDWIAFYKFPDFYKLWKEYKHILKQRNMCLKEVRHCSSLNKWTEELVKYQPQINTYRMQAIALLKDEWSKTLETLFTDISFDLVYKSGLPENISFNTKELLAYYHSRKSYDIKMQRTTGGVHRADFKIIMNNKLAIDTASRGQLKLLAISLLLAKNAVISADESSAGILLIDDLAAELDNKNKEKLLNYLSSLNQQLIITMTKESIASGIEHKLFHVKQGKISHQT